MPKTELTRLLPAVRRARYYNASRLRLSSFTRHRSARDDELIMDLGDYCLSSYTSLRKGAQRALDRVASVRVVRTLATDLFTDRNQSVL